MPKLPALRLALLGFGALALSCAGAEDLPELEDCDNGVDDDDDGDRDCRDSDCAGDEACVERCVNLEDDDEDGLTDCQDPDCAGELACLEVCNNGVDDDFDTEIDCADPDCAATEECEVCEPIAGQDSCTGDEICVGEDCVFAFGRQYRFSDISVALSEDVSWDTFGNAPDPRVQIFLNSNNTPLLETAEAGNTHTASYSETATTSVGATTTVRMIVLDGDVDADDVALTCEGPLSADLLRARDIICQNAQATLRLSVNPL